MRAQNKGQDFPQDFLEGVFDNIQENEITIPEEHMDSHAITYSTWQSILKKTNLANFYCSSPGQYESIVYEAIWKSHHKALILAWNQAVEPDMIEMAMDGFHTGACIASHFHNTFAFDSLIVMSSPFFLFILTFFTDHTV